jgi:hypothetical protein
MTGSGWSGFWSCHRELGNHSGLEVLFEEISSKRVCG